MKTLLLHFSVFLSVVITTSSLLAQNCGFQSGDGCPNTDYSNYGFNSNNNFGTIEYDNIVTGALSTVMRDELGQFRAWGHRISNSGNDLLTPTLINSVNYPALGSHKVLKVVIGANYTSYEQMVVLTTDGLYACGEPDVLVSGQSTQVPGPSFNFRVFQKVVVTPSSILNAYALPYNYAPSDVKMMTGTCKKLVLVMCDGTVWYQLQAGIYLDQNWTQAKINASTPLTGVVACRVVSQDSGPNVFTFFALKNDNTIWTWGSSYLGNGSAKTTRSFATQMAKPLVAGTPITIKMIAITTRNTGSGSHGPTYFLLSTTGSLYSMGFNNNNRIIGDWTTNERLSWVRPRYTSSSGPFMDDIKWISTQEHDYTNPSINVITTNKKLYAWGEIDAGMIGLDYLNQGPNIPAGLLSTDNVLAVVSGGLMTCIIKEQGCDIGFVGLNTHGSFGSPLLPQDYFFSYTFLNTPQIIPCGTCNFSALPIELTSLNSTCERDYVHIEWTTASEINNDYFTLEYSEDGINWVVLDKIDGAGNSNALINYSYNDYSIKLAETYYYRLSQTDYDGAQETFNIISQNCTLQELTVFPNPVDDELFILGISSGDQLTVTNTLGQKIVEFEATGSSYNLSMQNFSAGVYYIIQHTGENQVMKKFIKK